MSQSRSRKNFNVEIGGKTGSSSNFEDRWCIGFTPDYVLGVWTGYDTPRAVNASQNPSISIFSDVMSEIYENADESKFEENDEIIELEICLDSGLLANRSCERDERGTRVVKAYYKKGTEPKERCKNHFASYIDTKSGEKPKLFTPFFRIKRVYRYKASDNE